MFVSSGMVFPDVLIVVSCTRATALAALAVTSEALAYVCVSQGSRPSILFLLA